MGRFAHVLQAFGHERLDTLWAAVGDVDHREPDDGPVEQRRVVQLAGQGECLLRRRSRLAAVALEVGGDRAQHRHHLAAVAHLAPQLRCAPQCAARGGDVAMEAVQHRLRRERSGGRLAACRRALQGEVQLPFELFSSAGADHELGHRAGQP